MKLKFIQDEDITNYSKKCAMFIGMPRCSFKCEKECGIKCCQNSKLAKSKTIEIAAGDVIRRYLANPFTSAVVFGGLEPFDSWNDLLDFIVDFRRITNDDIVIYTGYTEEEVVDKINILKAFKNIIVKFGRFRLGQHGRFDQMLGVNLASDNQYAKKIS